jgi:hypothetical protein
MTINVDLEELKKLQLNNIIDLLEAKSDDEESDADAEETGAEEEAEKDMEESTEISDAFNMIFEGQEVDKEFVTKAKDAFKVAVDAKAKALFEAKMTEVEKELQEKLDEKQEESDKQIDAYLSYVVEEWLKENEVTIQSNFKAEKFDALMESLKATFVEHNVTEEEVATMTESADKIAALEQEVLDMAVKLQESKDAIKKAEFAQLVKDSTEGLAESEAVKFMEIIGELDVELTESAEGFKGRLDSLKKIFTKGVSVKEEEQIAESVEGDVIAEAAPVIAEAVVESKEEVSDKMKSYLKAVNKSFGSRK